MVSFSPCQSAVVEWNWPMETAGQMGERKTQWGDVFKCPIPSPAHLPPRIGFSRCPRAMALIGKARGKKFKLPSPRGFTSTGTLLLQVACGSEGKALRALLDCLVEAGHPSRACRTADPLERGSETTMVCFLLQRQGKQTWPLLKFPVFWGWKWIAQCQPEMSGSHSMLWFTSPTPG